MPDGCGSMLYRDSSSYDGQWRNGLRNGAGVLVIPAGVLKETEEGGTVTLDGQWAVDAPCADAEWNVAFPSGDKYLGQLKLLVSKDAHTREILPHGWGLSKRKDTGEVYEGQWMNGMRHGHGVRQACPLMHSDSAQRVLQASVDAARRNTQPAVSVRCACVQESITRTGARHCGEWRFGHPHGSGRHFDATSGCTLEGTFQYGTFVQEDSPGFAKEEETCSDPPPEVPRLVFEPFFAYPLIKCPLFQPPLSPQEAPFVSSSASEPQT